MEPLSHRAYHANSHNTIQMYDTLDISCQPGTATLTPTQLPAESHDLHPQWDQHISTVCTCGLINSNRQTNKHALYTPFLLFWSMPVNSILTKAQFFHGHFFSVRHTSLSAKCAPSSNKTEYSVKGLGHSTQCCSYLWKLAYIQNNICPFSLAWLRHPGMSVHAHSHIYTHTQ